jgi:hypothetical protein
VNPNENAVQQELQTARALLARKREETNAENSSNVCGGILSSSSRRTTVPVNGHSAMLPSSSSSSSPSFGRSRHMGTDVGVDVEAELDDAAQDSDISIMRTITDFSQFTDESVEKVVVDITSRIADNCSLAVENKRGGMISECNKLLTRVGLLKRDLLLFVRRARRYRRIVIFRKQLEWLNKMSTASIEEIIKYWNIDLTDYE